MAFKYLQETTKWENPNHVYIMSDGMNVGYIRASDSTIFMYPKPSRLFSKTGRTFKELKKDEIHQMTKNSQTKNSLSIF